MCEHYERNCLIQAPCCKIFVACRLCHDSNSAHGPLNRREISTMKCKLCDHEQPVQQSCAQCHALMARYYCDICHLFQDREMDIYHCEHCGICRVGKKENFAHCFKCGMCMSHDVLKAHECVVDAANGTCPVCLETLHDSTTPCAFMDCGHLMHQSCLDNHLNHNFACPICRKSIVNMSTVWDAMRQERSETQIPAEYAAMQVAIVCNDCLTESTISFHVVGLECNACGSFNTRKR